MSLDELETATEQPFQNVQRSMGKLVEQMQKGYYNYRPGETWTPLVNLYETETEYVRVYIRRLRAKLEQPGGPPLIITQPRAGYRIAGE